MPGKSYRILIAEDFEDNRIALKLMLNLAGFEVIEAGDGQQAIEAVRCDKPDLVLMDLSLPVIDGFEATRRLRAEAEFERLPIIIISAYDSEESRDDAFSSGGTDYLCKPVEFDDLKMMIDKYLNNE
jgi:CheY-like chemotaxis protein